MREKPRSYGKIHQRELGEGGEQGKAKKRLIAYQRDEELRRLVLEDLRVQKEEAPESLGALGEGKAGCSLAGFTPEPEDHGLAEAEFGV